MTRQITNMKIRGSERKPNAYRVHLLNLLLNGAITAKVNFKISVMQRDTGLFTRKENSYHRPLPIRRGHQKVLLSISYSFEKIVFA